MYFVFLGNLDNSKSVGTNRLIKEFAKIATSPKDIIENYPFLYKKEESVEINQINEVEEEYKEIYKVIQNDPIDINDIVKYTNTSLKETIAKLTMLELNGYIKKVSGGRFIRNDL